MDAELDLNGVIEEKSKLMNLSLQILKKGKFLPSGIFSIINNSQKLLDPQIGIKFYKKENIRHHFYQNNICLYTFLLKPTYLRLNLI